VAVDIRHYTHNARNGDSEFSLLAEIETEGQSSTPGYHEARKMNRRFR
jgi:hypothetical protein